jgi:uncharacterized protein (DUF58 family)
MDAIGAAQRRLLLLFLPVVAMVGAATGTTALVALAIAGLVLVAAAFPLSRRALLGLHVHRSLYSSCHEDDAVRVELSLENRSLRAASLVEIADSFTASLADRHVLLDPGPLASRHRRVLAYRALCSRSFGEYRVGPLMLAASDPLGLFRASRLVPQMETFTVFPRLHPVAGLDRLGALPSHAPESLALPRSGQSFDYLGVREYRAGDEARRIHWRASARRPALATKELETDLQPYFTLVLDLARAGRGGTGRKSTLEYLVRSAVSLVSHAARRGDLVQVIAEGAKPLLVPPGRGELHATFALLELVRCRQDGRSPVLDVVDRHREHFPPGSATVLLCTSAGLEAERLAATAAALQAGRVRPAVLMVNEASFAAVERFQPPPERARERLAALLLALHERGVPAAVLDAQQDLAAELVRQDLLGVA